MPRRRKPFIDKKHATSYRLIAGYVPDAEDNDPLVTEEEKQTKKEEQRKYGIFFDDDYNYMKHLRSLTEEATMVKVSDLTDQEDEMRSVYGGSAYGGRSVYGGSVDYRIFSTDADRKALPEESMDPDILASLDEAPEVKINEDGVMVDDDDEDFLDDDFINQAGGYVPKQDKDCGMSSVMENEDQDLGSDFEGYSDNNYDSEFDDKSADEMVGEEEEDFYHQGYEGRGNTQDYIIEAQTALILKNFEEGLGFSCMAQQLEEEDTRATAEDIENLKEILIQDKLRKEKRMTSAEFLNDHASRPKIDTSKYDDGGEEEEEFEWKELPPSKPKFDCVSILSLNSNTRNLPTDILPPSFRKKQSDNLSASETEPSSHLGLSRREIEEEIRLSRKADKASTFRPTDETLEEKKNRKKAIKEERKERRQEKKANKIVFSNEKQKMDKEVANLSKLGKGMKLT